MFVSMGYMIVKRLLIPNIIWILIWGFVLQPFILLYKQKDINKVSECSNITSYK